MHSLKNRLLPLLFGLLFLAGGIAHFIIPGFYLQISEGFLPAMPLWIKLSGIAEILAGLLLLIPRSRRLGWLAALLLMLAFLPLHIWHFGRDLMPVWAMIVRLLLQLLLIVLFYVQFRKKAQQGPSPGPGS